MRAAILDPQSSVVVAVAEGDVEILDREEWGGDDLSERFLEWGREVGGLTQEGQEGKTVLGFAIWRWKGMDGEDMGEGKGNGWMESVIGLCAYFSAKDGIIDMIGTRLLPCS